MLNQAYDDLNKIGGEGSMFAANATTRAARLQALSAHANGLMLAATAETLNVAAEKLDAAADRSAGVIAAAIDRYEKATTTAATNVEWWSRVQGLTAVALTVFTLGQVIVAVLEYLHKP